MAEGWQALKAKGNTEYSAGNTEAAINHYSQALQDPVIPPADRATLLGNRAQCWLKLGNNRAVVEDTTSCLTIAPDNVKALFRRGAALEALEDKRAALKDYRDALALNPGLADAAAAVRRLETALGEPSSLPPAGGGSKRERGGARGGGDAVSEEDVRQLEETKQRVREVALQKARAREQQGGAQKERRQLELTLGQVEGLKEDVTLFRPVGKMFMASGRPEMTGALRDKLAKVEQKLKVCASALEHIERQEKEADAAFLEVVNAIQRKSGRSVEGGAAPVAAGAGAGAGASS